MAWYIRSSRSDDVSYAAFGLADDITAPADFDGDGRADISVFRPSDGTWYRTDSSTGEFFAYQFGASGDRPTQTAFKILTETVGSPSAPPLSLTAARSVLPSSWQRKLFTSTAVLVYNSAYRKNLRN